MPPWNSIRLHRPWLPRAVAGDAIRNIESLCVLVYDMDGKLINKYPIKKSATEQVPDYTEGEMERKDEEGQDRIAESKTPYARFSLKIPYGRYRMYAVANMGDLTDYTDEIETMTGLKSILLTWQSDVKKNNQMLGHFTEKNVYCNDDEDYVLTLNRKNMELRAGIRRVASKVTLAYDGSQLKEGVFVYIKSARIKDIPRYCRLGNKNAVRQSRDSLIELGDTIRYDLQYDADAKEMVSAPFDEYYVARVTKVGLIFRMTVNMERHFIPKPNARFSFTKICREREKIKSKCLRREIAVRCYMPTKMICLMALISRWKLIIVLSMKAGLVTEILNTALCSEKMLRRITMRSAIIIIS